MQRSTFQSLLEKVGPLLRHGPVSKETKLLSTIWLLGNLESYRGIADRFDLSKGYLHYIAMNVCQVIHDKLRTDIVRWPDENQRRRTAYNIEQRYGFPGVVGFVDGSHIPIKGQGENRESYVNRKGFSSILLQGTCNDRLLFTDVFIGFAGSVHDARVWRNSPLLLCGLESGTITTGERHILGDSAYHLDRFLRTPYKDNGHLTCEEKNYITHSMARSCIERAFALLKRKFRRLKYLDMSLITEIPHMIATCTTLHNFVIITEDTVADNTFSPCIRSFGSSDAGKRRAIS